MFCTNCGKDLAENSKFCKYCGEKIQNNKQAEPIQNIVAAEIVTPDMEPKEPGRLGLWLAIPLVLLLIAGLGIGGIGVLKHSGILPGGGESLKLSESKEDEADSKEETARDEAAEKKAAAEESEKKAAEELAKKEAEEKARKEAEEKEAAEARAAYMEFIEGKRGAYYTVDGSNAVYYVSKMWEEYVPYYGEANVKSFYSFINPEKGSKELLLVRVEAYLDVDCYVVIWQDGELYVSDNILAGDENTSSTINKYGLMKLYDDMPSDTCNYAIAYIDSYGKQQWLSCYVGMEPFDAFMYSINDSYSEETEAMLTAIEEKLRDKYVIDPHSNAIGDFIINEFEFDGMFYYTIDVYSDSEICREYIKMCEEQGLNIVDEELIRQLQKGKTAWLEVEDTTGAEPLLTWIEL